MRPIRSGCDHAAPRDYGPHKTIYNRFVRWNRLGVFNKSFAELARKAGKPRRLMIDATRLKGTAPPPVF
jgi:putative transposase